MTRASIGVVTGAVTIFTTLGFVANNPAAPTSAAAMASDTATLEYMVSNVKVIQRINSASNVVAVRLYLLGGSRQLTEETAGIEPLLLRAAQRESDLTTVPTGSRFFLEFTADWTVTGFVGLEEDIDSSWSAFVSRLERPTFSETSFEWARGRLVTAARRRYTQPDLRVRTLAQRGFFQDHPYALDPLGTEESLDGLSHADLERYWDEQFVTSRMQLIVVGRLTRPQVESLIKPTLGRFPAGDYVWTLPPPIPQRQSNWLIEHRDLPTNYILGYFAGPSPMHEDYLPFRVAVALLSSQIAVQVRERASLSYAAYAPFVDRAIPAGGMYATTSEPVPTLAIMRIEVARLPRLRIGGGWWRRFLDQFTLNRLMEQMTSDGQAESLARARLYFGDLRMADEYVQRLRRVSLLSMQRAARRYMVDIQYGYLGDTLQMSDGW